VSESPDDPVQELRSVLESAATDGVRRRDIAVESDAREVIGSGTEQGARLGRLAEWAIWLSGAHGCYPPRPLDRVTLLQVGTSAPPNHPVHQLMGLADVSSKSVALQADSSLPAAAAAGIAAVDEVIDAGCDLLVCTAIVDDAVIGTLVALLLHLSSTEVVGESPHLDEERWAQRVATIRDLTYPARGVADDPVALLHALGSPELAALTGMLLRAAARRTPVLLDSAADCAAALCASRISILASWWYAAPGSGDPATIRAIEALGLDPIVELGGLLDAGAAALTTLPLLRTAQLLAPPAPS
jgi:nicotinate-nucleotide--dimethylbenzimidazole phosphoribosyltransferase